MASEIDTRQYRWKPLFENFKRLVAARRKSRAFPDFVEASRIAPIPLEKIATAHPHPTCEPDVDSVRLGQGAARDGGGRAIDDGSGHGFNR